MISDPILCLLYITYCTILTFVVHFDSSNKHWHQWIRIKAGVLNFSRVKKEAYFWSKYEGKGKQRRKKTEGFSLISFKLLIPPKSKPKARIIFKASILVPKKQEKLLPKLKIYCPQLFMFLPYQMISIIVMPWKSKELLLVLFERKIFLMQSTAYFVRIIS